jgi:hypothetical protein
MPRIIVWKISACVFRKDHGRLGHYRIRVADSLAKNQLLKRRNSIHLQFFWPEQLCTMHLSRSMPFVASFQGLFSAAHQPTRNRRELQARQQGSESM